MNIAGEFSKHKKGDQHGEKVTCQDNLISLQQLEGRKGLLSHRYFRWRFRQDIGGESPLKGVTT